jgi:predicted ATPase
LLKSTRQQYHQRITQVLEEQFPEIAEAQPELLAHHCTEAGLVEPAVGYWQRAGERSTARSAYVETAAHLTKGLAVLQTLPDTPTRAQREVDMQITLGQALGVTQGRGAPEVGHAYARARELCHQVGNTPQLFRVLGGLSGFYQVRGEFQTARELREQCLALAQHQHDAARLIAAHAEMGVLLFFLGEFVPARAHLEQALALSGPQQDRALTLHAGEDTRVYCLGYMARILWYLGYPGQALTRSHEMLTYAQELSHTYSLSRALYYAALLHEGRREWSAAQERAEAALTIATEQGFGHSVGVATVSRGQALAAQGQGEAGIAQMHQGLAAIRATGQGLGLSRFLAKLASAYGGIGQAEEGLCLLAEALAWVDTTGERFYEAEVYRIKGELLLRQAVPDAPQVEACFQQALAVARHQQARSWELRAAMSLARLWQQQGKRAEARELLAPIYGWFTEGFDTADLQEAKALLDALV